MLSDEEIKDVALKHVQRFGGDQRLSRPVWLSEPDAVFYKVERQHTGASTTLVSPFVVLRESGRLVTISAGMVMPGVITKLWGWPALRADPDLMKAVVDPDFSSARHIEVWSAIVREILGQQPAT
jgi:hypothetical protein